MRNCVARLKEIGQKILGTVQFKMKINVDNYVLSYAVNVHKNNDNYFI